MHQLSWCCCNTEIYVGTSQNSANAIFRRDVRSKTDARGELVLLHPDELATLNVPIYAERNIAQAFERRRLYTAAGIQEVAAPSAGFDWYFEANIFFSELAVTHPSTEDENDSSLTPRPDDWQSIVAFPSDQVAGITYRVRRLDVDETNDLVAYVLEEWHAVDLGDLSQGFTLEYLHVYTCDLDGDGNTLVYTVAFSVGTYFPHAVHYDHNAGKVYFIERNGTTNYNTRIVSFPLASPYGGSPTVLWTSAAGETVLHTTVDREHGVLFGMIADLGANGWFNLGSWNLSTGAYSVALAGDPTTTTLSQRRTPLGAIWSHLKQRLYVYVLRGSSSYDPDTQGIFANEWPTIDNDVDNQLVVASEVVGTGQPTANALHGLGRGLERYGTIANQTSNYSL